MGNEGRPSGVSGLPLQETPSPRDSKPVVPKRVRFSGLDGPSGGARNVCPEWDEGCGLFADQEVARIPTYDEACRSLTQHLAFVSGTSYGEWLNFIFTLQESTPGANTLCSRHASCSPQSSLTTNYDTFLQVVDASPTPTPLEDFIVFGATPLGTGPPTMTEVVEQFMEDLLTQEFSPIVLAEDS